MYRKQPRQSKVLATVEATKVCSECKQEKPQGHYHCDASHEDGLQQECKRSGCSAVKPVVPSTPMGKCHLLDRPAQQALGMGYRRSRGLCVSKRGAPSDVGKWVAFEGL